MYSFFRKKVSNPCGRCNYSCVEDSLQCVVCDKWHHRKCLHLTKKKFQELKGSNSLKCTKKCEFTAFPFHQMPDKAFIALNALRAKFPCHVCTAECRKKWKE